MKTIIIDDDKASIDTLTKKLKNYNALIPQHFDLTLFISS